MFFSCRFSYSKAWNDTLFRGKKIHSLKLELRFFFLHETVCTRDSERLRCASPSTRKLARKHIQLETSLFLGESATRYKYTLCKSGEVIRTGVQRAQLPKRRFHVWAALRQAFLQASYPARLETAAFVEFFLPQRCHCRDASRIKLHLVFARQAMQTKRS